MKMQKTVQPPQPLAPLENLRQAQVSAAGRGVQLCRNTSVAGT